MAREPATESTALHSERQSIEIANEVALEALTTTPRTDLGHVPSSLATPPPSHTQPGIPEDAIGVPTSAASTDAILSSENADCCEPSSKRRRIEDPAIGVGAPSSVMDNRALDVPTPRASTQTAEVDTRPRQTASARARPTHIVEVVVQRNQTTSNAEQPAPAKGKRKGKGTAKKIFKDGSTAATSSKTKTRRTRSTSTTTNVKPRKLRKRKDPDTEDEKTEIIPSQVKMAELCKDSRKGQTSQREKDLANMDWEAVLRKQKEQRAQEERGEAPQSETVDQALERAGREQEAATRARAGIKLRLVNGQMVVDDQSLQVDRHANAEAEAEALEEIEENDLTRRITSGSWMKREKVELWDEELTDRFYEGLRMFGTDFMIISKMFPGRSRRTIKLKFTKEERQHPDRIKEALIGPKVPMDLAFLSQLSNVEYEDPRQFHEELEKEARDHAEELKRQEEQAQEVLRQRRAEKLAAAMTGDDGPEAAAANNSSAKENNNNNPQTEAGNDSGKRKRGGKKQPEKTRKKMFSRHGGGEELEIVGTIET